MRLRHLMDEVQRREIGERIRGLHSESAETNRSIADFCEVGERTVAGWIAGDGISYKNAVKVAQLFDADIDWLWRGRERGDTPDPFADPHAEQLDRIERKLDEILERLEPEEPGDVDSDLSDAEDAPSEVGQGTAEAEPARKQPPSEQENA